MNACSDSRAGFAVAVVVLLLFAVAVAAAVAYQVVRLEAELATYGGDVSEATVVAEGGLERYFGEQLGTPADSVTYVIGSGSALVRSRKVATLDATTDLYLVRSTASVADDRHEGAPATRTAARHARLHKDPLGVYAAMASGSGSVHAVSGATISGVDAADPTACLGGGSSATGGVMNFGGISEGSDGTIVGSPRQVQVQNYSAFVDSLRVRWDVLESTGFPIRHDGSPPDWSTVPADSFPVVRATEDLVADASWSGRGVLIVPGEFSVGGSFDWEGIILAGRLDTDLTPSPGAAAIRGVLVGGLDGLQGNITVSGMDVEYHSCNVSAAMAAIAYLEPLENTFQEEF